MSTILSSRHNFVTDWACRFINCKINIEQLLIDDVFINSTPIAGTFWRSIGSHAVHASHVVPYNCRYTLELIVARVTTARCVSRRRPNSQTGRCSRQTSSRGINSVLPSLSTNIYPGYIRFARFPQSLSAPGNPSSLTKARTDPTFKPFEERSLASSKYIVMHRTC